MQANTVRQPTDREVGQLDVYAFMAVIGKRVIHRYTVSNFSAFK